MKRFLDDVIAALVGILSVMWLLAAVSIISIASRAMVLIVLWRWFVVTGFELAPLSLPMAGGLMTIVTLLSPPTAPRIESDNDKRDKKSSTFRATLLALGAAALYPLIALGIGWVFMRLM